MEPAGQPIEDEVRAALERELYWSGDPITATSQSTRELRLALLDFAATMRADEHSPYPREEPQLGSRSRWRRKVKASFYVVLRPITHRYDRLLGDLAILNRLLAERLGDAETEIQRLRDALEDREGRPGSS